MSAFSGTVRLVSKAGAPAPGRSAIPDQPGLGEARSWSCPGVLLVHRQRTVTPEDRCEAQPTPLWESRGALVFDGHLHDRPGLCEQVGIHNHNELPDSVLVARAFEKWGEDAPSHLLGDFALAVFDARQRRLILATDTNGGKTLYFYRTGDVVAFSTVLPALLSIEGVPHELDETVLADFLANNYRDNRCSFFRGVRRVLGADTVVLRAGEERLLDHWPLKQINPLVLRDDREYLDAAREVLDQAVRSRMRSIAPVAFMASGGLDSACLLTSALRTSNQGRVPVFTAVPDTGATAPARRGRYASEREMVEALQSAFPRLGCEFVEPAPYADMSFAPEKIFNEAAAPLRNVVNIGWTEALFARMAKTGAGAFIDGAGGNATLTWDGLRSLSKFLFTGRYLHLIREAHALGSGRLRSTASIIWREAIRPQIPRPPIRDTDWQINSSLNPRAAAELDISGRMQRSGHDPNYILPADRLKWLNRWMTVTRAHLSEINSWVRARYGVETRRPLLDIRLVRFCASIPEDQFLRSGQKRRLAHRLLQDAGVPPMVSDSTRRGEWCPEWFSLLSKRRPSMNAEIEALREAPLAARLIDLDRLTRIVADWPADAAAAGPRRMELDGLLTRAFHVGAFIRWAESKDWSPKDSSLTSTSEQLTYT